MELMSPSTTVGASPSLHPCYSEQAHRHFARLHLAVAPKCNIQCHYCNRKHDCANESRPGVVSELLTPDQAVQKTLAVGAAIPHLAVVGIAGPGDPLANPEVVFQVFRALTEKAPDLTLCLSTNGLALPDHIDELCQHHVGHVTITINCIDPNVGAQIYPWIVWRGRRLRGREAAEVLITRQLQGLDLLVKRGVLVKINSVLIPGVNDQHLVEVNRVVKAKGAFLHNIMPLISRPEHGAYYGKTGQREPTDAELAALRDICADEDGETGVMKHCQQCRADAVGLLGQDRGAEFTLEKVAVMHVDWQAAIVKRAAVRAAVEQRLAMQARFLQSVARPSGTVRHLPTPTTPTLRVAVGSTDGQTINAHFGHVHEFLIYDASPHGAQWVERRPLNNRYCNGPTTCGDGNATLPDAIQAIQDCAVLLCARIGFEPWRSLQEAGIQPNSEHALESITEILPTVYETWRKRGQRDTTSAHARSIAPSGLA